MKMRLCLIAIALVGSYAATAAQNPPTASGPGLVVGSGNFFSPIVSNLDKAIAFYRDGLGLEVTGAPANADENAPLRNMFGLPAAQLRWTVARPAGSRNGVEIVEISKAAGRPLNRRITDPGAMTLVISTSDEPGQVADRLKEHGGTGLGSPGTTASGARVVMVGEPDDHFVEIIGSSQAATPLPPRVRLTVQNLNRALALYRDALGLGATPGPPTTDLGIMTTLGIASGEAQTVALEVPGSKLAIEFVAFSRLSQRHVEGRIQDPGSTRLQLQVRDLTAATQAIVRAGGHVVSTGGRPVDMPAGRGGSIKAVVVQDPDNLFLVLIEAPQPRT